MAARRLTYTLLAAAVLALAGAAVAASTGQEVTYSADSTPLKGYIAHPKGEGKHPAVLVVHEWWGNNDYPRRRADMLAELGYVAMALDMYGNGTVVTTPADAGRLAGEIGKNGDVAEKRFRAAMTLLASQPDYDGRHMAAIGYCFGGGVVLNMARRGLDLAGVVSFHGSPLGTPTPAQPGAVKAKLLVLNGAADPFVKPEQIEAFNKEMQAAKVDYRFVNYPGAVHAFTNPDATENGKKFNLPLAYQAEADKSSWDEMKKFLSATLK